MSTLAMFLDAVQTLISYPMILFVIVGFIVGCLFGMTPGVGASLGLALALPLTLPFEGEQALVLLTVMYAGAMYGGAVSAIVLNVPGTGAAVASTFEGYPLARQGQAHYALSISAISSSLGGVITASILIALSGWLVAAVLMFAAPEYALVALLGLALIPAISQAAPLKALFAGGLGLMIATLGLAPMAPTYRYTMDIVALSDGISFIAVLLGVFAISEMIRLGKEGGSIAADEIGKSTSFVEDTMRGIKYTLQHPVTLVKSSIIGMLIGSVPGAGASVSNIVAYAEAVRSKPDEAWMTGNERGLVASESANNGTVGGSLVPVLSFGIPGSGSTAIILGGLLMHGLRPGPDLFAEEIDLTILLFSSIILASVLVMIIGIFMITRVDALTRIDTNLIIPVVLVLSVLGGFTLNANFFDVWTVVFIGILGYYFRMYDYSIIALLMGVILGPIVEENMFRGLQMGGGSYTIFVRGPLSITLVILIILVLALPVFQTYKEKKKKSD